jgi:hypothetical protein
MRAIFEAAEERGWSVTAFDVMSPGYVVLTNWKDDEVRITNHHGIGTIDIVRALPMRQEKKVSA